LIHAYDDPVHAPLGLRPARVYADVAGGASHAQHMPSHIFIALGMWNEVISANEIAVSVADRRVERKALGPESRIITPFYGLNRLCSRKAAIRMSTVF
jgi:hypothetical protein